MESLCIFYLQATVILISFPLKSDKTTDAKSEDGNDRSDPNHNRKDVAGNIPVKEKGNRASSQTNYSNNLVKLLLIPVFLTVFLPWFLEKQAG